MTRRKRNVKKVTVERVTPRQPSTKVFTSFATKSDNETTERRRHVVAQKNPSNLFRIKSYSFNERAQIGRRASAKCRPVELIDRLDVGALLLAQNERDNRKSKKCQKSAAAWIEIVQRVVDTEAPHIQPSLRHKVAVGQVASSSTPRPTSVPATATAKCESFLRQSLHSIRRSFSSSKRNAGCPSSAPTSEFSATSSNSSNCGEVTRRRVCSVTFSDGGGMEATVRAANGLLQPEADVCGHEKLTLAELKEEEDDDENSRITSANACCKDSLSSTKSSNNDYSFADTPPNSSMAVLAAGISNTDARRFNCVDSRGNKFNPVQPQQQQELQRQQTRQQYQYHSYALSGSVTAAGAGAVRTTTTTTTRTLTNESSKYSPASSTADTAAVPADSKSLKQCASAVHPLVASASTASVRSISPSRRSAHSNSSITAKHEQASSAAAAAAATNASATTSAAVAAAAPTDKEKKRKEVSGSRVKKFHRHFSQVSKDEKLINYFSCALVSDILLQGHLYITDQHFAFYSNVFGYVTKVVIPTSSVTKISKEKTAKIIPNAVGVATADERHVFGSFISREAAFRLMCSVCPPLAPAELLLPCKMPADVLEYSEELSIEDDSSCSISGNESPPQAGTVNNSGQTLMRNMAGSNLSITATDKLLRHSDIPNNAKTFHSSLASAARASAPPTAHYNNMNNTTISSAPSLQTATILNNSNTNNNNSLTTTLLNTPTSSGIDGPTTATSITMIIAGTASSTSNSTSSTPSPSSVSSTTSLPTTVLNTPKTAALVSSTSFKALSKNALLRLKFPKELHVVYLGVMLSVLLALLSGFLLYRILDIEAKTSLYSRAPVVNWGSANDDDIFSEALRWQKELQTKSTEEAQIILNANLEQIAKVRRSLETLSMLIHDRSSPAADSATATVADAFKCDDSD